MRNKTSKSRSPYAEWKRVSRNKGGRLTTIHSSIRGESTAEMLTVKDLEAFLKIDVKTLYAYVQKGLIPYVRIQSNLRFSRKEILDWIDEQSFHPQNPRRLADK